MHRPDMLYECLECENQEIVKSNDYRIDGRVCKNCGGHSTFVGFAGIDLAHGKDQTAYVTLKDGKRYTPG